MAIHNVTEPLAILDENGLPFHSMSLHKYTFDSVVMSLGDKITGDAYYIDNSLVFTMREHVIYKGIRYSLVNPPTIVREGMVADNSDARGMTKYTFEFYHPMCKLSNLPFTDVAVSYDQQRYLSQNKKFSWIGYLQDFVDKLNKNLDYTEWVCELSPTITNDKLGKISDVLTFDNQTIADALKTCYETWEVPFIIDVITQQDERYDAGKRFLVLFGLPSNEIYENDDAKQAGTPYIFKFGQGVGLKNNNATPKNNKIITRLAGCGSEDNIPYGYPQIIWVGDPSWTNTLNDETGQTGYPIYDGIVGGQYVKLIKHPFTRTFLMPSIYVDCVNKKVNPYASGYDPDIEIVDYYDADDPTVYPHTINPLAPSYEIHQFENIKPEFGEHGIVVAIPINDSDMSYADDWDDTMDDDGNYKQGYFKVTLPPLWFDLYACAAITQEMQINMRSGPCIGCTFDVQVDWEEYKINFYDRETGEFSPQGAQRDFSKYPDSTNDEIEIILKKDINTFGTLMPNIYQNPQPNDQFVILGISLPQLYVDNAQIRLDEAMRQYMLENNVYYFDYPIKFDEFFLTTHQYILSQIRNNTIVRFRFGGENIVLYIKQITIKYGDNPLPQYDITLTDDVEIVLNQIGQVTDDVSRMRLQVSALQSYFDKNLVNEINNKLSRVYDDIALGRITFNRGFDVGKFIPDSTGASMTIDGDGATSLELDFLTVRRAAKFREITIQELKHIGGEIALTAAAMECCRVEQVDGGYKCYFETTDGDKRIYQEFVVGDQARCQQFKLEQSADGYMSTKYYWRIVKAVGDDYIVLSNVDGEYDGASIPAVGDKIVQLGYRKEYNNNQEIPYRTTAIILSATSNDAPSTKYYEGITSFSLSNVVKDEGYQDGAFHSNVYGTSYIGAPDNSSYVSYTPANGLYVNGTLTVGSKLADGTDVNKLIAADINLLRNSGFTGDYESIDLQSTDRIDSTTQVYSPSFKYWNYNNGCVIIQSDNSASGYECYLSSSGRLSQTIEIQKDTTYVVSVKAYGVDISITFGGVTNSYGLDGTSPKYFAFKVSSPVGGVFELSTYGGCWVCEPMVAEGNVFDTWSKSPLDNDKAVGDMYSYNYLMSAFYDASTIVNKGLLLTQIIKVGNYRDGLMVQETGGMNGFVTEQSGATDPFLWGGGTMEQAIYTIMKYANDPSYVPTDDELADMAKFVVTHSGRAILNDIVLRGYIYALGGYFRGEIQANTGKIGNVDINQDGLGVASVDVHNNDAKMFLSGRSFEYTRKDENGVVQARVEVGQDIIRGALRKPLIASYANCTDQYAPTALDVSSSYFDPYENKERPGSALNIGKGFVTGLNLPICAASVIGGGNYAYIIRKSCFCVNVENYLVVLAEDAQEGTFTYVRGDSGNYNVQMNGSQISLTANVMHMFVVIGVDNNDNAIWFEFD